MSTYTYIYIYMIIYSKNYGFSIYTNWYFRLPHGRFSLPDGAFKHTISNLLKHTYCNIRMELVFHTTSGTLWSGPSSTYLVNKLAVGQTLVGHSPLANSDCELTMCTNRALQETKRASFPVFGLMFKHTIHRASRNGFANCCHELFG